MSDFNREKRLADATDWVVAARALLGETPPWLARWSLVREEVDAAELEWRLAWRLAGMPVDG